MKMPKDQPKIQWLKTVERPGSPLKNTSLFKGLDDLFLKYTRAPAHLLVPEKNRTDIWYYDKAQYHQFAANFTRKMGDLKNLERFAQEVLATSNLFINATNQFKKLDFTLMSCQELKILLQKFHNLLSEFPPILWGFLILDSHLTVTLKKRLGAISGGKKEAEVFYNILTANLKPSSAETEKLELFKIRARATSLTSNEVKNLLENHAEKFAWLPVYDMTIKPWQLKDFQNMFVRMPSPKSAASELKRYHRNLTNKQRKIQSALASLKDAKIAKLTKIVQAFLYLRTYRTDALRRGYYNFQPFLWELARRMKLKNYTDAALFSINELYLFLSTGRQISPREIKRRKHQLLIIKKGKPYQIISSPVVIQKVLKQELPNHSNNDALKGIVAFPGIVRGKVRIIKNIKDIGHLKKGEILVTPMTTPEMTIAINKAAAIVTDEGGMTCHAAIVARENKIPCVVGTREASSTLKTSDLIEVDANSGIVHRLKSPSK